jgi:hypothetical protein
MIQLFSAFPTKVLIQIQLLSLSKLTCIFLHFSSFLMESEISVQMNISDYDLTIKKDSWNPLRHLSFHRHVSRVQLKLDIGHCF